MQSTGLLLLFFLSFCAAQEHITYLPPAFDSTLSKEEWAHWSYAAQCPRPENTPKLTTIPASIHHGESTINGAIDLKGLQSFMKSTSSLSGAFYQNDTIFLVGKKAGPDRSNGFLIEDFLVAVDVLNQQGGRGPICTMTPPEDDQDRFRYTRVRYSPGLENTHLGQLLFETDRTFKCLSLGYDNITRDSIQVEGGFHKTKLDFREYSMRPQAEQWQTLVLTPRDVEIRIDAQTGTLMFAGDKFALMPEDVTIDGGRYVGKGREGAGADLARHFNQYLFDYARQFPVLKETMRMAKLIAVLKWLWVSDRQLAIEHNDSVLYQRYTPEKTPVCVVKREKVVKKPVMGGGTLIESMYIGTVGGVDLNDFRFKTKRLAKEKQKFLAKKDYVVFCLFRPGP